MDGVVLRPTSYTGSRSNVTMPNQQAPTWKALQSGKPKIEPNDINDLLYANVGVLDVPRMVINGLYRFWTYCGLWR